MKKEEIAVHVGHCCKTHGCKYGDDNCPVAYGDYEPDSALCQYCVEMLYDDDCNYGYAEESATYDELVALVKALAEKQVKSELAIEALIKSLKSRDNSIEDRFKANYRRILEEREK